MKNDALKPLHLICITTLFNTSSILVFRGFTESGNINWVTPIISAIAVFICSISLFSVANKYQGKNIYEVIDTIFPRWLSLLLSIIYAGYAIYLLGRILKNTGILITNVALNKTPQFLLELFIIAICAYALWYGVSVFGRLSILSFVVTFFAVGITFIMSFSNIAPENFLPLIPNSFESVISDSFSFFAIPFAENILLYNIYSESQKPKKSLRYFAIGLSVATLVISAVSFLTLSVLGLGTLENLFYPFYTTVSVIKNGSFFSRMEVFISASLILNLLTKLCVCFYAALGFFNHFNVFKKKSICYFSVAILSMVVSLTLPSTNEEMKNNLEIYKMWAPFIQILIPITIIVGILIKKRLKTTKNPNS
ncbi:MAG: endospore germination permease [Oscillospiraceae bacterium]|nr:endospore germination permease [Oscillospiraceae bacterium]